MPNASGSVSQTVMPSAVADGTGKSLHLDRYGRLQVAALGNSVADALLPIAYRATTPTWGTGIAIGTGTRATFSATECTALFRNTAGAGGKYVIPQWVRMIITAAGTANTNCNFGLILDTINRYSSGGTALTGVTGANSAKSDASDTPVCTAYAGAITALAASAPRQMGRSIALQRAAAPAFVVGDEIIITFGSSESLPPQVLAATASKYVVAFGPLAIAPGHSALLHYWGTSQTATPSAEYEMAWLEV